MTTVSAIPRPDVPPAPSAPGGPVPRRRGSSATDEPRAVRAFLIGTALLLLLVFLVLPLAVVFVEAFGLGRVVDRVSAGTMTLGEATRASLRAYWSAVSSGPTWEATRLTLLTALVAVPLNVVFGVAAAWAVTKFDFRGKSLLLALIDVPFAISPLIAGLALILLFGEGGWFGSVLGRGYEVNLFGYRYAFETPRVVFALPGIVLATVFITFPFVARELIPLMQAQGTDEEQAARVLGAGGWQMFARVTLPNIKWGLLYGLILCNARAMGEFGAVYAVANGFRSQRTLPLHIAMLEQQNVVNMVPVFAVSSLLAVLAVVTLVVKAMVEWRFRAELNARRKGAGP